MNCVVIINPISGTAGRGNAGPARAALAERVLRAHGIEPQVRVTEAARHAYELAKQARERGADLVVAWGGDGTVNEVGSALAFGPTALAIVPAGSGNGLARDLDISRKPERAFAQVMAGRERRIDVGELNGRLFFNVTGVGFDAVVAERFNAAAKSRRGALGYVASTIRELRNYKPPEYEIAVNGDLIRASPLLLVLANGAQYGYGAKISPDARVDDGYLDLVIVEHRPYWTTLWEARRLFTGSIHGAKSVSIRRVQRAVIRCSEEMLVHLDGETCRTSGPLTATIHPGALKVRC